ncbi:hypothetical protein [Streptomyces sp. KR80]|uniref:hypothetical protein n=1 Tax=Streptomyces sp. KR80 TaxID=3457426 RepID=UPI003FD56D5A
MSRETDSSSSGPRGGGGAAYPSGTPPYGTGQYPAPHSTQNGAYDGPPPSEADEAAKPDEPKTETTLTTRVRINIPGSRPIPPVVVRTPVDGASSDAATGGTARPASEARGDATAEPASVGESGRAASSGAEGGDDPKTSDWFAPRKASAAPAPSGPGVSDSGTPPYGTGPGAGTAFGVGADTDSGTGSNPLYSTGPNPVFDTGSNPPYSTGSNPAFDTGSNPVFDTGANPAFGAGPGGSGSRSADPSGATSGPAGGDVVLPPGFQQGSGPAGAPAVDDDTHQFGPQPPAPSTGGDHRRPPAPGIGAVGGRPGTLGGPGPFAPGPGTASGRHAAPDAPSEGAGHGYVSGDTLVSGNPLGPPSRDTRFPGGSPSVGSPFPGSPSPGADDSASHAAGSSAGGTFRPKAGGGSAQAKQKGRSKLVVAGAGLFGLVGVAYAAGLMLDHADVPNGTTVLGVEIGGTSTEAAVKKLEAHLATRSRGPLAVTVDGKEQQLKPNVAGLTIDAETTVRNAAGRDYNPVSVIGSLFGGAREAEPEIVVDEEKLAAELKGIAGDAAGNQDGTIVFKAGKAIAVPGKPHRALHVTQSVQVVGNAYRERAETGRNVAVELPVGMQRPTVDKAELDRAMKEFAKPAMSGLVTVQTDASHQISFSPENSLPKFLTMKAVGGKLVDTYDLEALKELYGSTFDGVLIQRGNGKKTPVTPQDVAGALRQALRGTTPDERIQVIETNAQ